MAGTTIYRTQVLPEWVDYNAHLRDAYYVLVLSLATDALMDRIGLDAAYRARTSCTLFSLEMHMHWLHEVKGADTIEVDAHILDVDKKRMHVGFDVRVIGRKIVVATADFVFMHVHQGAAPGSAPFPPETVAKLTEMRAAAGPDPWAGPASRAITLGRR